jgi:hypothetical protein
MQNDVPNRTQPDYTGLGPRSSRTGDAPADPSATTSRPTSSSSSSGTRSSNADATINRMTLIAGALIFGAIALMLVMRDPARGPGDEPRAVTGAGQGTSGTTTNQSPIGGSVGVAPAPSGTAPVQPGSTPATAPR